MSFALRAALCTPGGITVVLYARTLPLLGCIGATEARIRRGGGALQMFAGNLRPAEVEALQIFTGNIEVQVMCRQCHVWAH